MQRATRSQRGWPIGWRWSMERRTHTLCPLCLLLALLSLRPICLLLRMLLSLLLFRLLPLPPPLSPLLLSPPPRPVLWCVRCAVAIWATRSATPSSIVMSTCAFEVLEEQAAQPRPLGLLESQARRGSMLRLPRPLQPQPRACKLSQPSSLGASRLHLVPPLLPLPHRFNSINFRRVICMSPPDSGALHSSRLPQLASACQGTHACTGNS